MCAGGSWKRPGRARYRGKARRRERLLTAPRGIHGEAWRGGDAQGAARGPARCSGNCGPLLLHVWELPQRRPREDDDLTRPDRRAANRCTPRFEKLRRSTSRSCWTAEDFLVIRLRGIEQSRDRRSLPLAQTASSRPHDRSPASTAVGRPRPPPTWNNLLLSTIHSAKGALGVVHIIHAADGIFPRIWLPRARPASTRNGDSSSGKTGPRMLYFYFPLRYYHRRVTSATPRFVRDAGLAQRDHR
jgi:hypothetical protein